MVPDSEVITIMCEILTELEVGQFQVKLNHRQILDGIFQVCGVPEDNIRPISSAVDKLDKLPWADVKKEMVEEKNLAPEVADKIGEYVKLSGGAELCEKLEQDEVLMANTSAKQGVALMKVLFKYLEIFQVADKVKFDLSLARGLDYYTGVIYEAVLTDLDEPTPEERAAAAAAAAKKSSSKNDEDDDSQARVGSIAAGGRYDNLVGMFAQGAKKNSSLQIPCVGVSIGVERVFSILLKRSKLEEVKANQAQVYVIAVGDGLLEERMKLASELWKAGIPTEFAYKAKPKLQNQFSYCDKERIPYSVIIGQGELEKGVVKIKNMASKVKEEGDGVEVNRTDLVKELLARLTL
jgi:histidyl-tRNA synthetase